jgi:putative phosphoribosyl transferase
MAMLFRNRREAGRALGQQLAQYASRPGVVVLGLPRGGVPVAFEVAEALDAPLDVFLVRKLGFPGNEEFAMGAIASGGVRVVNEALLRRYGIPAAAVERVVEQEERELRRRERSYRGDRAAIGLAGCTVILVDDGLATGSSMQAAVKAVRLQGPERIVVAVPVGPIETVRELARIADEVACVATPEPFLAVGRFYDDFDQVGDEEVAGLLQQAAQSRGAGSLTPA